MSRNKKNKRRVITSEQAAIEQRSRAQVIEKNATLMLSTAQTVLPLIGYIVAKIEEMNNGLDKNTAFSMKLKNKANHAISECEDFINTFEGLIATDKSDGYTLMTDILYPCLDSWFQTLRLQKDVDPSLEIKFKAKLRYHDPYMANVKECQESFEDGYGKGYCDCVRDIQRELYKLKDVDDGNAVINIVNGRVEIKPVEKEMEK